MTKYGWSCKDRFGNAVYREVAAHNAEQSKELLIEQGYTDLKLFQDEVIAATNQAFPEKTTFLGEERVVTAADRAKALEMETPTFLWAIWDSFREAKGLYLMLAVCLAYQWYRGYYVGFGVLLALAIAWPVFRVWAGLPLIYFQKLTEAKDWHRWDQAVELARRLELIHRFHFIKVPEVELVRTRAQALSAQGKLPEAIALLQPFENSPGCPSWLFKTYLSGLHSIARQYDKALEYEFLALKENPTPVIYLGIAEHYLRHCRDPRNARAALCEVEKATLVEAAKPFHHRCKGILAYHENNDALARQELETSLKLIHETKMMPFRDGNLAIVRAYLCCVLARQGERITATKHFAAATEYLHATCETDLIAECKLMLG